jgi:hypothetical protein
MAWNVDYLIPVIEQVAIESVNELVEEALLYAVERSPVDT